MSTHKVVSNAVQHITDDLTQQLLSGKLKPGDQLPTAQELSEYYGVSRNTIQEAVRALTYIGVLEIRRPVGTFVCQGFTEPMINPLLYGVILNRGDSYDELMELREIMEIGTMLTVIRNAADEEIASLQKPLAALAEACRRPEPSMEEVFPRDDAFHAQIMALSHNRMVERIATIVRTMTHDMRYESSLFMVNSGRAEELYQAHEKLYQLLATRDVDGVYREIRSTYFVPDEKHGAIPLSEKDR